MLKFAVSACRTFPPKTRRRYLKAIYQSTWKSPSHGSSLTISSRNAFGNL
jgi:hypothetical protein